MARMGHGSGELFLYTISELFDYRICKNLTGDAFYLGPCDFNRKPVRKRKGKILPLAHRANLVESDFAQSVMDGLSLRIQDRCLQRNMDMCLHHP